MKTTVGTICEFYNQHPELIGSVKVLTPNGFKIIEYADITAENSKVVHVVTEQGKELYGSPDHRVMENGLWKPLTKLKVGDYISTIDGNEQVLSINKIKGREDLYDLQVADNQRYYTNGILSHNSSMMGAIEFALFGQTSKDVPLNKIVNWKNGKNCEVKFHFTKDGVKYVIHRGHKPSILKISKDGVDQPLLSDKRLFQKEIEQDIIGMDFKFAQMMTFQNANNSISLFNTKKEDKRKFIEKFFNLEVYTKMNELVNKKLLAITNKLSVTDAETAIRTQRIEELNREISNYAIPNLSEYQNQLDTLKTTINEVDKDKIQSKLDELNQKLKENQLLKDEYQGVYTKRQGRYVQVKEQLATLTATLNSNEKRKQSIGDVQEKVNLNDRIINALKKMEGLEQELETISSSIKEKEKEQSTIESDRRIVERQIKETNEAIKKWENTKTLDSVDCPSCFQKVDPQHIENHIKEEIDKLTKLITPWEETITTLISKHKEVVEDKVYLMEREKELKEKVGKKNELEKRLAQFSNLAEQEQELNTLNNEIESDTMKLTLLNTRREALEAEIKDEDDKLKELNWKEGDIKEEIKENERFLDLYNKRLFEYETLQKSLIEKEKMVEQMMKDHQTKIDSKTQLEREIEESKKNVAKSYQLKDYLSYIKETLKDENAKQYAISSFIPFIEQRTNHYLSETGHSYYIKLDDWMDVTIMGSGVGDCEFGNLSGGEGRTIDLALKFAFQDVSRRQAGSYLDILVLDELLDSSIDSYGIESLMNIIRLKQKEDNLKVFIISHREEVSDFGVDNIIRVKKKNGFSRMEVE